ncbi:MAG: Ig-like domain-containing protein [Methylococcaceae bacterium]
MKLTAIGYQTLQTLHRPQKINQQDFTVSYQWNDYLRERWINSEQQLEQWFDIKRRPEGAGKGLPLTVQMTLDSELKATQNGNTIYFANPMGTEITYNKLKVWDSTGRELPASMQLASNTLNLIVDDSTAQYPLTIDPSFQQQAYIKASNTDEGDWFGKAIAISGDTLVVGAPKEDSSDVGVNGNQNDNSAGNSGAVYVFIRNGAFWIQQAYLKASNTSSGSGFGNAVAIYGDTLIVGANAESSNSTGVNGDQSDISAFGAGAAYVFIRSDSTWTQQAYLKASNSEFIDFFGYAVAISGDTVVVGARQEDSISPGVNGDQDNNFARDSGAAYVFTRSGSAWTQQAYLKASNAAANHFFGESVTISGDTLVVGARGESSNSTGVNGEQNNTAAGASGAAYVFIRDGETWTQQAYLKASNAERLDFFGMTVALYGDTLVVGAEHEDSNSIGVNGDQEDNSVSSAGAAYIFNRNASTWTQQAYLKASNVDVAGDQFGRSVAIFDDMVVVGAISEDSNSTGINGNQEDNSAADAGAAYIFMRNDSTWMQTDYLKASNTDANDIFGNVVAVFADSVVIGALQESSNSMGVSADQLDNSANNAGAVYAFGLNQDEPSADLVLSLNDGVDAVLTGDTINFTVTVHNLGPDTAENVIVTDTLPSEGMTFVATEGCTEDIAGIPTCSLGNIAAGETSSYHFLVTIDPDIADGVLNNFAIVKSETFDPNGVNNSTRETTGVYTPRTGTEEILLETRQDDAEESVSNGKMTLFSSDLELTVDGTKQQKVGLRYPLNLPRGATILNASIQFTAKQINLEPTTLLVSGEAAAHALPFANVNYDISNRTLTTASVAWMTPQWTVPDESSAEHATPDLSAIIQELVNQADWELGNSIAFIISGDGKRVAKSFHDLPGPVLHLSFSTELPVSEVPVAVDDDGEETPAYTTGINQVLTVLDGLGDSVERNDNIGFPAAEVSTFGPVLGVEFLAGSSGLSLESGTVEMQADGGFTYTPTAGFVGIDSFIYTLANTEGSSTATVYISVKDLVGLRTLWVPVATGTDDAEQNLSSGSVALASTDLEFVRDGLSEQLVGVRFQEVNIPHGATIIDAYVQYTSDEASSETTALTVYGENNTNALTFTTNKFDISNRMLTAASVPWTPAAWNTNEQNSSIQATPNLSAIVQEIIDHTGWKVGNPMVFITSGTGSRVAESYNGTAAPMLHVSFLTGPSVDQAPDAVDDGGLASPAYKIGINRSLIVADGEVDIIERNDSLGFPLAHIVLFDSTSAQGGTVSVNQDGSFSYTPAEGFWGIDSFEYTLENTEGSDSATVYIDVLAIGEVISLSVPVVMETDDAEENLGDGNVDLSSSDLEMSLDRSFTQLVGLRFQTINVPHGAKIIKATIQYQTDETSSEQTVLSVRGEASVDAATFLDVSFNISTRALTSASVDWMPSAWNLRGEAGPNQATSDLSIIVQELVDQTDWTVGNAMVFITSGSGNRVAESFNGIVAPILHLEYAIPLELSKIPTVSDTPL